MHVFITGVCGFVGSRVAMALRQLHPEWRLSGCDNFVRPGSRLNAPRLETLGIQVIEADLRDRQLSSRIPSSDWVIDCAANPSVLAGLSEASPSLDVMDHNLSGTIHLLEHCKKHQSGFILVSTSRVYSCSSLSSLPMRVEGQRFEPRLPAPSPLVHGTSKSSTSDDGPIPGFTEAGINESFSTAPPLSLYGVSKLASELLALEYASTFQFPLWINRCGVMAGAGQFGRPDQGIVAYWIHSLREGRPLKYIGFQGLGHQVRDCLHPDDLAVLLDLQIAAVSDRSKPTVCNVSGGRESAFSLRELTDWCENRWRNQGFPKPQVEPDFAERPFDCPWIVLDSSLARRVWKWTPRWSRESIWTDVASHAEHYPDWLSLCNEPKPI